MKSYKFKKESINFLQEKKKKELFFDIDKFDDYYEIKIKKRGYSVNNKNNSFDDSKVKAISFFSGAGGLDIGTQLAGVKVISCNDFDKDSISTLRKNSYFQHTEHIFNDIRNLSSNDFNQIIKKDNPEKLILTGGPPCQPFSKAGYWVGDKRRLGNKDPRNMISEYLRLIKEINPDGFILENVESILHPKNKDEVFYLEDRISDFGYEFIIYKANSINFGVPQKRKRIFFIASKKKIKNFPEITHGDQNELFQNNNLLPVERVVDWIAKFDQNKYFENEEKVLGKTYEKELKEIPPGENYFALTSRDNYPKPKFESGKRFWSFLLKLHPLLPSWTVAAQPGPWVGPFHWDNRRLRVSEISAIQTFPEDYVFFGSRRAIQNQIGNAVPVLLAKSIVQFLIKQL